MLCEADTTLEEPGWVESAEAGACAKVSGSPGERRSRAGDVDEERCSCCCWRWIRAKTRVKVDGRASAGLDVEWEKGGMDLDRAYGVLWEEDELMISIGI